MPHLLLRRVTATDRTQHVLAAVHLKSKLWASPADQLRDATDTVHDIMRAEDRLAKVVRRSIVIGDLNMNPFDPGITNADGFHAVMSRKETKPAGRMVNGKRYAFYYNPMWGLLGDRGDRPPGTFRRLDGVYCLFWNMLDQVLIRPDLINRFSEESLRILDHDSQSSLLTPRGSSSPKLCDHLPFVFEMDL